MDEGFCVSPAPVIPPSYGDELRLYVQAVSFLLTVPDEQGREREDVLDAFHERFVLSLPPRPEEEEGGEVGDLFPLTLHGIFKHMGAGAVCALAKTEEAVLDFVRRGMEDVPLHTLRSSWDSVNFLSPKVVHSPLPPAWLHRDMRLGGKDAWRQCMLNLSAHPQEGPEGDASFVCLPGSHTDEWTLEELAAAAGGGEDGEKKAKEAWCSDWVRIASFSPQGEGVEASAMWRPGRELRRVTLAPFAAVMWDSRLIHSGSLFHTPGRLWPRMTKYVYLFDARQAMAAARKSHSLFLLALGKEGEALSSLPIAPTTPHRGNKKNSDGHLPTFRVRGRALVLTTRINTCMDDARVRPFFTLPHAITRGLLLRHPSSAAASMPEFVEAVRGVLRDDRPSAILSAESRARLRLLAALHAAPPPPPRRTKRVRG